MNSSFGWIALVISLGFLLLELYNGIRNKLKKYSGKIIVPSLNQEHHQMAPYIIGSMFITGVVITLFISTSYLMIKIGFGLFGLLIFLKGYLYIPKGIIIVQDKKIQTSNNDLLLLSQIDFVDITNKRINFSLENGQKLIQLDHLVIDQNWAQKIKDFLSGYLEEHKITISHPQGA